MRPRLDWPASANYTSKINLGALAGTGAIIHFQNCICGTLRRTSALKGYPIWQIIFLDCARERPMTAIKRSSQQEGRFMKRGFQVPILSLALLVMAHRLKALEKFPAWAGWHTITYKGDWSSGRKDSINLQDIQCRMLLADCLQIKLQRWRHTSAL
jgi:hypothetical protein